MLSSSGVSGTFGSVVFTGGTPASYTLSYLPAGAPTYVQLTFAGLRAAGGGAVQPVPALGRWALMVLCCLIGAASWGRMRPS